MPPKVSRRVALGLRILFALASLGLAVLVAGVQTKVFKDVSANRQLAFAAGLAVVIFFDNCRAAWRRHKAPGRQQARARMQKAVVGALVTVGEDKNVALRHLGGSVFAIRRRGLLRHPRLVRVLRFRLDDHPQPSQVVWTPGKGAIGRCWKQRRKVHSDWLAVAEKYGGRELTAAQFAKIPPATRDGFNLSEFVGIVDKYAEILAVPVLSHLGEIVGVISIDVAAKADLGRKILNFQDVEDCATGAAVLVRDDLGSVYADA